MKIYSLLRTAVILCLLFFITYALADGIQYGSTLGTFLALGSMAALAIAIHLFRKLAQLKRDDE